MTTTDVDSGDEIKRCTCAVPSNTAHECSQTPRVAWVDGDEIMAITQEHGEIVARRDFDPHYLIQGAKMEAKLRREIEQLKGQLRRRGGEALREAADAWLHGEWADAPRRADRVEERIANGQHVGDWLRARAERLDDQPTGGDQ